MKQFFELTPGSLHFSLFGFWHIFITLLLILGIVFIYRYREKIKKWKYHDKAVRYAVAMIMFLNMTIYYGSKVLDGTWRFEVHLPLHFCFISGYLFMLTLITNNKKLFKYTYFFSFAGPLPAILLPDIICGPDRFIFWQFVISHHFFLLASIYVLFVLDWKIEKKDIIKAMIGANLIFFAVFIFNQIFDTNYIMTSKLPDHILKLFPFLTTFNYPILWLELAGLATFLVAYIPVKIINKQKEMTT